MSGTIVDVPRSIFSSRHRTARETRHRRQIREMLEQKESESNHLTSIKMHPKFAPSTTETRPLPKSCSDCLPEAEAVILEEMKFSGLIDCLIPFTNRKLFPIYWYYYSVASKIKKTSLPSWKDLANDPNLLSLQPETAEKSFKEEVLQILNQLQVKGLWNHFASWICSKFMAAWFKSVLIHNGQLLLLKDIHARKLPVIYVPTYRSNFDKALILWMLSHHGVPSPVFFRDYHSKYEILKYFGGIGAGLDVIVDPYSDRKYSSAVSVYVRHLLRKRQSLIINLETGRIRTGRPCPNICGSEFLRIINDEYKSDEIEDAYFVPISISYEVLPEIEQLFGKRESLQAPSWWSIGLNIFLTAVSPWKRGNSLVKVDIAQPVSFRELYRAIEKNVKMRKIIAGKIESYDRTRNCSNLRWGSNDSLNSVCSLYGELAPLYPEGDSDQSKLAHILDIMSLHLVYDAGKCESVMPTHMVAFLLMKKFPKGVNYETLVTEIKWLINVIQKVFRKDFGFYLLGCNEEIITKRALTLLKDYITVEYDNGVPGQVLRNSDQKSLLKLEYYSNYLLPCFMMDAVIATAIFILRGEHFTMLRGQDEEIEISDGDLMKHCRRIYESLTSSFLLHSPCLSAERAIRQAITQLNNLGHVSLKMPDTRRYQWEDDDDDYYYPSQVHGVGADQEELEEVDFAFLPEAIKVLTKQTTYDYFNFCKNLASPYFEIFAFLTDQLEVMLEKDEKTMKFEELIDLITMKLVGEQDMRFSHCRELCTKMTVTQFLASCEDHGVLEIATETITLQRSYVLLKNKTNLVRQSANLLQYVTY